MISKYNKFSTTNKIFHDFSLRNVTGTNPPPTPTTTTNVHIYDVSRGQNRHVTLP